MMNPKRNQIARKASVAFSAALMAGTVAAADLSHDPRVADAVSLWSEWVSYQAGTGRVPAVSWGIVHDQSMIASGGIGKANPAENIPATPETIYSICSISKLFTSVALMQQREAGAVRLDDPVAEHLDWFNIQDAHPNDEPITIRRLLTHSSGLPRESDFPYWTDPDYPFPTSEEIKARLDSQQTLYPTSKYFQYSNLGLTLVGEIVAATADEAYEDYMRAHLLDPLSMEDTYTDIPVELHGNRMAVGHTALKRDGTRDTVIPFQARGIAPAAGFASNVNDLAKFAMWQFRVLDGEDQDILRASSLREMHRVQWMDPDWETTWGLGFSVRREGDRTYARHGGGCPGYYTEFRIEPASKIGVIALTNTIGSPPGQYAAAAFELVGPALEAAIDDPEGAPERDGTLERYAGVFGSIWGQAAIAPWEDGLAILDLDAREPAEALTRLQHIEDDTFRAVRDDESLGETIEFEFEEDGQVSRVKHHSIYLNRITP